MDLNKNAIVVKGLGKCYRIGQKEQISESLAGSLVHFIRSPLHNYRKYRSLYQFSAADKQQDTGAEDILWALQDVSFVIPRGEVVGVIGRNGAGKSTLLKIISRITDPTSGYAEIRGRVSSLLEVGTGFHPELTGRENVYLNGTILGMTRKEVQSKFDEIVDFSGVEKFIDTPAKRYSSGMKVRLAFSVAAHLEPEILIIDEVLAVGDAEFQQKCLGKMQNVSESGRTVLFVSHNMGAINQLCSTSLLLEAGRLVAQGESRGIVEQYLESIFHLSEDLDLRNTTQRSGDGRLRFTAAYLQSASGKRCLMPIAGEPLEIVLEYESQQILPRVKFLLTIFNHMGVAVTHCTVDCAGQTFMVEPGAGRTICRIDRLPVPLGEYKVSIVAVDDWGELDSIPTACVFRVETSHFFRHQFIPPMRYSTALVDHSWTNEALNSHFDRVERKMAMGETGALAG